MASRRPLASVSSMLGCKAGSALATKDFVRKPSAYARVSNQRLSAPVVPVTR